LVGKNCVKAVRRIDIRTGETESLFQDILDKMLVGSTQLSPDSRYVVIDGRTTVQSESSFFTMIHNVLGEASSK
jgi:hypothetical protein